jgi:hypothetical protein
VQSVPRHHGQDRRILVTGAQSLPTGDIVKQVRNDNGGTDRSRYSSRWCRHTGWSAIAVFEAVTNLGVPWFAGRGFPLLLAGEAVY